VRGAEWQYLARGLQARSNTVFICAGRKGAQFIARTRRRLAAEFNYKDSPQFSEARAVAKFACEMFIKGEVDRVDVLYTDFINTLTQKPSMHTLLPVSEIHALSMDLAGEKKGTELEAARTEGTDFLFEPSAQQIFEAALPQYVNFKVYQLMLEARASEHSARMVAMKSATDNANGLIKSLTLQYNKMRQASITKELLEICSATMSLA
jgi:F-type H+-transporting ATPase subunit gamma